MLLQNPDDLLFRKAAALHALVLVVGQNELQTGLTPWGKVPSKRARQTARIRRGLWLAAWLGAQASERLGYQFQRQESVDNVVQFMRIDDLSRMAQFGWSIFAAYAPAAPDFSCLCENLGLPIFSFVSPRFRSTRLPFMAQG
jgi:hypothetical protein